MADQLISTAVHQSLPDNYVRPETQRPRLHEVVPDADIPVVDLANPDRAAVVSQIGEACRTHGFFQVLNHGVALELMLAMLAVAYQFFDLPPEEKAKLYSDDPAKKIRLSTSFNVRKETGHNWRDYLRLHCHPLDKYVHEWPASPPSFREIVSRYCSEVRALGFRLYGAISESLGLEQEYIKKVLGEQEQHMAVNFYPKCPAPELTYGLPAHTDPNALTILLMDQQVAGLQVLKDGRWIAVNPRPNALVINIGDQLQAYINAVPAGSLPAPPLSAVGFEPACLRRHLLPELRLRGDLPVHFVTAKVVTLTDLDGHQNRFRIPTCGVERLRLLLTPEELDSANLLFDPEPRARARPPKQLPAAGPPGPAENPAAANGSSPSSSEQQAAPAPAEQQQKIKKKKKKGRVHGGLPVKLVDLTAGVSSELRLSRWESSHGTIVKGEKYLDFITRCSFKERDVVEIWAFKQRAFRNFGVTFCHDSVLHLLFVKEKNAPKTCRFCPLQVANGVN